MILPADLTAVGDDTRRQLVEWAGELQLALSRLGDVFFPADLLDEFRAKKVEHVVLCIDPLFARVPYPALIGNRGPIVDEPWSLSIVTASTELIRILDRHAQQSQFENSLAWIGPDRDVNENLGGNTELKHIQELAEVVVRLEDDASLPEMVASLSSGQWCHFRGHAIWTGSIGTSGPVMAGNRVFSSDEYDRIAGSSSFLFTAACLTGFGEAVGSEMFGALIDYDRAGLLGAILTNWPIHGDAATVFTASFYGELRACGDAAVAMKRAGASDAHVISAPLLVGSICADGWMVCRSAD